MNVRICQNLQLTNCRTPDGRQPQLEAFRSQARFIAMAAGTRGGKTRTCAAKFVQRIFADLQNPKKKKRLAAGVGKSRRARLHYWVVSPIYKLLEEPKRYLMEMIPIELFENSKKPIVNEQMWLKGDILVEFRSANDPFSLVSVGLDGMWLDEAARINREAWLGNLRGRLSDRGGWALFSSTPLGKNWFYDDVVVYGDVTSGKKDPAYETFQWHTSDNQTIAREEIETVRRTMSARYFKREYEADFAAFMGNIFDFDERIHVVTPHQFFGSFGRQIGNVTGLFKRVIAGVDWGWSSPGSMMVLGDLGNRWVLLDESYGSHRRIISGDAAEKTWANEARRFIQKWGVQQFFCDPARPDAIFDFTNAGLPAQAAFNDISYGIRRMDEIMHAPTDVYGVQSRPRFQILSTCEEFIREIRSYQWDQTRSGESFTEHPAPGQSDHGIDGVRYAVVELTRYTGDINTVKNLQRR